ncbi:MAG: hypothetical protein LBJ97_00185 [Mycoplasmataceae bacterium]|nr:hypothetical protein [Mycoplasmataceae bacterium]
MSSKLTSLDAILIFLSFLAVVGLAIVIKKIYYRFRYNQRVYIFPRIGVKGIANIAMVISIAIATLLLLTIVSAGLLGILFRAYPGWRVTIEGILIKVGGLLFGPIIGIFIGAATDLLSVALTAGMFHYGYFIAAMVYGLLAGIVKTILNVSHGKQVRFAFISTILVSIIGIVSVLYVLLQPTPFQINFFTQLTIQQWQLALLIGGIYVIGLAVLWGCMFAYYRPTILLNFSEISYWFKYKSRILRFRRSLEKKHNPQEIMNAQLNWSARFGADANKALLNIAQKRSAIKTNDRQNWLSYFAPVLMVILLGEATVNIFMLPQFDLMFSLMPYDAWLGMRSLMLVITIPMNIAIVYPVYRIVCPTMKYDYMEDTVESRSVPLMVD